MSKTYQNNEDILARLLKVDLASQIAFRGFLHLRQDHRRDLGILGWQWRKRFRTLSCQLDGLRASSFKSELAPVVPATSRQLLATKKLTSSGDICFFSPLTKTSTLGFPSTFTISYLRSKRKKRTNTAFRELLLPATPIPQALFTVCF